MDKKHTENIKLIESRKHYGAIDGLRTIACICIVMMHIKANNNYVISGFVYDSMISSFTDFVFLFMVVSAFGMCCGYYERILNGTVSLEDFYRKRYMKILPFFAVLVLIDIVMSRSIEAIYEGFADVTLLFGLFPNNITVIGVGWFLGVIFAFYLIFPFYCVLIGTRKRAWGAFGILLALNFALSSYFEVDRTNIVYCLCYLLAGGLIYLYREELERFSRKCWWGVLSGVILSIVLYYTVGGNTITRLLVACMLLTLALGQTGGVLENRFTRFFSSISMEVYLSHMVIFRAIERAGLNTKVGEGWLQYAMTVVVVLIGAVAFSVVLKICQRLQGSE